VPGEIAFVDRAFILALARVMLRQLIPPSPGYSVTSAWMTIPQAVDAGQFRLFCCIYLARLRRYCV
jgi:hypothetical protein